MNPGIPGQWGGGGRRGVSAVKWTQNERERCKVAARVCPPRELKQPNVYVCAIYVCTRGAWCVILHSLT
jgi:hypothetical protein